MQLMGLQNVVPVGEQINIRDNINPGGGGEYLDQEGIFGIRGTMPGAGQVALLMLAGVDTADLSALEKTRVCPQILLLNVLEHAACSLLQPASWQAPNQLPSPYV
jgi:hypothetical protein